MKWKLVAVFTATALLLAGCKTQKTKFEFLSPTAGNSLLKGEKLRLTLQFPEAELDSVIYAVDGNVLLRKTDTTSVELDSDRLSYGNRNLSAKVYYAGKEDIAYSHVLIVPPAPVAYQFDVVNVYPHDSLAFTQGLQYEDGVLYESTGLREQSSLRKVNLKTGEVLKKVQLDDSYFAEGLTIVENKIVLLTYTSGIGFVYDKSSFRLLQTFDYPDKQQEGWGIAYDGKRLIRTDGSAYLHFMDPTTFRDLGSIEVFDNNGPVPFLNELEFVEGKLYANLYYQDRDEMVIIDPATGAVEGKVNFVGLYDGKRLSTGTEMNGVAYNRNKQTFYVTGKDWTKLYEVKLTPRQQP